MTERLQKLLAAAGLGSRREIEQWLRDGRVSVDGRVAKLGDRAAELAQITLDGRALQGEGGAPQARLAIYHKPVGEVTTRHDPQGRPTVFDRLPPLVNGRWVVVGRLDFNTSGLLLFTNDGELAHRLMHPSFGLTRAYRVRVRGQPSAAALQALRAGLTLEDGPAHFDTLEPLSAPPGEGRGAGSHSWFEVTLQEGRNREVRRLWKAAGFEVSRLVRLRYGPYELPADLKPGQWRTEDPRMQPRSAAPTMYAPREPPVSGDGEEP